ncbi:MAG TPA: hypothetical protein VFV81_08240 [Verrucomicrobiae bacterium]|nr:hypothetical protein [Verrucomicrobiae bacterium]
MLQNLIFGMHWKHDGRLYYDEVPAQSREAATEYFIGHKRDDVTLMHVELIAAEHRAIGDLMPA